MLPDNLLSGLKQLTAGASRTVHDYVAKLPADYSDLVPYLRLALNDVEHRDFAAYTLAMIGPAAEPAIPDLIKALHWDPENYVSQPYIEALLAIDPGGGPSIRAIAEVVDELAFTEIFFVAETLLTRRAYHPAITDELRLILSSEYADDQDRKRATDLLEEIERIDGQSPMREASN